MEKKYELTDDTKRLFDGTILHRIRAVRDFGNIHEGDLGGYIEKEENLSHDGDCWVCDNAKVGDDALIEENALVFGTAEIYGHARVSNNARIFDKSEIHGYSWIYDAAVVEGCAEVYGTVRICGHARLDDNVVVDDNAYIYSNHVINGNVHISKDAWISSVDDYFAIENIGSRHGITTFYTCGNNTIRVNCGCFNGTLEEFANKVKEVHGDNMYAKEYIAAIAFARTKLSL